MRVRMNDFSADSPQGFLTARSMPAQRQRRMTMDAPKSARNHQGKMIEAMPFSLATEATEAIEVKKVQSSSVKSKL